MTEPIVEPFDAVLGSGAGGPLTAPSPWTQFLGYVYYGGGMVLGVATTGGNQGNGTINAQGLYINGTLVNLNNYLLLAGGTLTGPLILAADPTNILGAVTKQYVDNNITTINTSLGNYLLKSGGTITGNLAITGNLSMTGTTTLSADPAANLQAATKQYVDNKFSGLIAIPDAPSDGSTYGRNNAAWTNVLDAGTF